MESSSHRLEEERKKQDEIRRQISLLQAQLVDLPDEEQSPVIGSKRKQVSTTHNGSSSVLAPATPSPKKKCKLATARDLESLRPVAKALDFSKHAARASVPSSSKPATTAKPPTVRANAPAPSTFLNRLAALTNDEPCREVEKELDKPSRSASFTDAAPSMQHDHPKPKRNEDLTIAEDIEPGPYEHKSPLDDPNFDRLEPHSGIHLLSRVIPHEDINEYMRGRFYLSPSRLYSCVRLSADKQSYEVPVLGDWVTIAVVAEMGEVKYTRSPVTLGPDEDEKKRFGKKNERTKGKEKQQAQDDEENSAKGGGKRYVNVRLVDFGATSKGSETGGAGVIRGDACLSMLLFESDRFEWLEPGEEEHKGKSKKVKVYKGGSKGAFESMHKLRPGDVVALLNSRVLKPFQRNSTSAVTGTGSSANMLAVSPESAGAVLLVGRARDFGRCNARKKDGQPCGSWCDTRVSEVCDWHMQRAVESRRAGRSEFSVGTTGMSTSAAVRKGRKRAEEFDHAKQWGLVPNGSSNAGGATYVLSGHVISSQSSDIFVGEKMGREAQARAQRKAAGQEVEKALKQLMKRDKDGMRSVLRAREAGDSMMREGKAGKQAPQKGKDRKATKDKKEVPAVEELTANETKSVGYSTNVIKGIGFDPAAFSVALAGGRKNVETGSVADKLQVLAKLQQVKKERGFNLKPRPAERIRSGVVAPGSDKRADERKQEGMVDLDDPWYVISRLYLSRTI